MSADKIESVKELIDKIVHLDIVKNRVTSPGYKYDVSFNCWFRGEPENYKSALEPSIFREPGFHETSMFHSFKAANCMRHRDFSCLEWLCLMQHYGLPTRLLDWTESPLIALFFAAQHINHDGAFYMLEAGNLNNIYSNEIDKNSGAFISNHNYVRVRAEMAVHNLTSMLLSSEEITRLLESEQEEIWLHVADYGGHPVAVLADRTNPRMIQQSSVFTIHGGKVIGLDVEDKADLICPPVKLTDVAEQNPCCDIFKKFIIPKGSKKLIIEELIALGIHDGTIFPDLEGQAKYLKDRWSFRQ